MSSLLPLALIAQTNIFRVTEIKSREIFGNKQTYKPNQTKSKYIIINEVSNSLS